MSRLGSWRDPGSLLMAAAFAIFAALANAIWIPLDNATPAWDQAHYLDVAWQYKQALGSEGFVSMFESIRSLDPSRGPLFSLMLLPFFYVLDDPTRSGLALNFLLAPVLYLAAGQIAMHIFRSWVARLLAIFLTATLPLLVGLYHNTLQDFALATFATVTVLLLLKSDSFRRPGMTIALGAAMGLGTLTKVTFPVFVAGPFLVIAGQVALGVWRDRMGDRGEREFDLRRLALNLAGLAATYLVLIVPWYVTNLSATAEYIEETTGGSGLSLGAGPTNPYTFDAISSFTMDVINGHVSWIVMLAGIIALLLTWGKIVAWVRPPRNTGRLFDTAFLLGWVLIPYLSLALGHNQDIRLMAPALPGIAVIVAGAMAAVEQPRVRAALIGVTGVMLIYQTVNLVTPIRPSFMPREISLDLGSQEAVIPLDDRPLGYEKPPGENYGTAVMRYIESAARRDSADGTIPPTTVCLLQSDALANGNTMNYLAHTRGDPFTFVDILARPGEDGELVKALSSCEFALYVAQPPLSLAADTRVGLVNLEFAANFMTPNTFALFQRPAKTFATSADPNAFTDSLQILVRKPERATADAESRGDMLG